MEKLIEVFRKKIALTNLDFVRNIESQINWSARLICLRGSRGTGKTTLFLQHIKKTFGDNLSKVIYVSLDNLYFSDNSLVDFVDSFVKNGGQFLFLDEVHKYPDWSRAIKNIYDDYPELHVAFTGSSLLGILNARSDLSRRALVYELQGLSFREYLSLTAKKDFPILSLEQILEDNEKLSAQIASQIKPFEFFEGYLKYGYYPYFLEGIDDYYSRLAETVNMILEVELPLLRKIDVSYIVKIKKLLSAIGKSAPFIPNTTELASHIQIARQTLLQYFEYLEESKLIYQVFKETRGLGTLEKPDKIFLENTNLMFLLGKEDTNIGNIRETFAFNQLSYNHEVLFSEQSDFFVDKKYTFEVGGKNKKRKQIKDIPDSYILADDIEFGTDKRIPLWLLGFMY
ncbi:MAG: AAA family ATPase [Treponemataceae bacterium]|nr:AAA family ATPase [Spirochaetales bacterium]MDY6030860.1 AAA family ATPase [Treponemataceae bacterium]